MEGIKRGNSIQTSGKSALRHGDGIGKWMPVGTTMPSKVAFVRVTRDLSATVLFTLGPPPPIFVVFGSLYLLIYLVYYHRRCKFLVMMVHVVVPVAIYRPTLDKAVAKEYILSLMCTAFLAAHVCVAAAQILCCA